MAQPAPATVTPVVAQKPAATGVDEMMTDSEKAQLAGVDMDQMVALATEAAQNAHNTQTTQAEPVAPVKAAVSPAQTVQAAP